MRRMTTLIAHSPRARRSADDLTARGGAAPLDHLPGGWKAAEAERAFAKALRARRRASLLLRLRRGCAACARLAVHPGTGSGAAGARGTVREIPLASITGSVEPNRATLFDCEFRPAPAARSRWLRVWHAEQRGAGLPPISVVAVEDGFLVRDGHHRVSVARSRGAHNILAAIA
jgi:hypothetical protein